jgi:hypothetical protein
MHKLWTAWKTHSRNIYRILLVLFIASSLVSLVALRHNNQTMVKLRGAVYTADKNNANVNGALNNLRAYVYAHMNTNLTSDGNSIYPPIQLKYTYQRLQAAAQASVDASNSQIYTDAEIYCQQQDSTDFSGHNRVPCVTQYVTTHGASAQAIPTALYEFDFISPSWSPDLAGWSLVVSGLLLAGTAASFVLMRLTRR